MFTAISCALLALVQPPVIGGPHEGGTATGSLRHQLEDQLQYYEILSSHDIVGQTPSRIKRDIDAASGDRPASGIIEVKFTALGRHLHLYLTHDTSIFSDGFEAVSLGPGGIERRILVSAESFYSGHVSGETNSTVSARWEDNALVAKIQVGQDTIYVEPLTRLLPKDTSDDAMLVYRLSDLKLPHSGAAQESQGYCGGGKLDLKNKRKLSKASQSKDHRMTIRSTPVVKNTCSLFVIADYTYFREIAEGNENLATNQMIDMVNRVDKLFRGTDFGSGFTNMGFSIKKTLVHTEPSADVSHYNSESSKDADELLDALANHTAHQHAFYDYCLVHLFTARKEFKGVLGMAYMAKPGYSGGICTLYRYPPEPGENVTNCGFSTKISKGNKRVLDSQSEIVLAHELGHNWGSSHDPDLPGCKPDPSGGGYIMHEYSSAHIQANSKVFSPCSKRNIRTTLAGISDSCFQVARDMLRGNYRIDEGEACDAGITGDQCCGDDFELMLGPGSCSVANSVCCINCSVSAAAGTVCRYASPMSCRKQALCDGNSTDCPHLFKEAGSKCLPDGYGRCNPKNLSAIDGEVTCASICEVIGLRSCLCRDAPHRCHMCCQKRIGEPCSALSRSYYDEMVQPCPNNHAKHCRRDGSLAFEAYEWVSEFLTMKQDTPCAIGYCDAEGVCQKQAQDKLPSFLEFLSNLTPSSAALYRSYLQVPANKSEAATLVRLHGFAGAKFLSSHELYIHVAVKFMKDNVVGTVVIFALILWPPLVFMTKKMDRRWERKLSYKLSYSEPSPVFLYNRNPIATHNAVNRTAEQPHISALRLLSSSAPPIFDEPGLEPLNKYGHGNDGGPLPDSAGQAPTEASAAATSARESSEVQEHAKVVRFVF